MNSGIYTIENTQTHKVYVGSATNFNKRWDRHIRQLSAGRYSAKLQNSWNKHGRLDGVIS